MTTRVNERFRIGLVDDQKLVRLALGSFLEDGGRAQVVWSAPHGEDIWNDTHGEPVDAIIISFESQLHDPIETVHRLSRHYPKLPLVALVASSQPARVHGALAAGCTGVLGDSATLDDIDAALRALASGQSYVQAELGSELVRQAVNGKFRGDGAAELRERNHHIRPEQER